jgi:hypothetical protein
MRAACTIIARNYLAQARVLADSFSAHHPGSRLTALVLDDPDAAIGPGEPFDVVRPGDVIPQAEFNRMATMYTVVELATAVKPALLRHLLTAGATSAAYFDPDIRIFTPLPDIFEAAEQHGIALTPHALTPLPRGGSVTHPEDVILGVGIFNLGFIAVSANTSMVDWWADHLARECIVAPERGRFVDQRWVDLVMGYFSPAVLRDPGMNVAWWNLATRRVTTSGDNYLVDGMPLRFFHFSGYDPRTPWLISRHQGLLPRALMADSPALRRITGEYASALEEADFDLCSRSSYGLASMPGGTNLDPLMRGLYRAGVIAAETGHGSMPPNPFSDGAGVFAAWLAAPDPAGGGPSPAPRYGHALWLSRPDLRNRFHDIHGDGAIDFATWMRQSDDVPQLIREATVVPPALPLPTTLTPGIHVIGLLHADRTEAEIGRRVVAAARDHGVATTATAITRLAGPGTHEISTGGDGEHVLNVITMPSGRVSEANHYLGRAGREGRRTAAIIVADLPAEPIPADVMEYVDEFWVVSSDTARRLRAQPGCPPVYLMPALPRAVERAASEPVPPLEVLTVLDSAEPGTRPDLGITLEAFQGAFARAGSARLSILVVHADHDGQLLEELAFRTRDLPNVVFESVTVDSVGKRLSQTDVLLWLPAHADAALLPLDALASGIPVVASDLGQIADVPTMPGLHRVAIDGSPDATAAARALATVPASTPGLSGAPGAFETFIAQRIAAATPVARTRLGRFRGPRRAA